jgi:endoglucanase
MRGLFHQRAATALAAPFTAWTRPKSSMHDTIYESEISAFVPGFDEPKGFDRFDVIGGTIDLNRKTEGVVGGWYDAADWDRNQCHYVCAFDMLNAYEFAPAKFTDGQLNLPESSNGIPDLLDEVEWGIECWRRSQDDKGGVSGFIESSSHTAYDDPKLPYAFSRRTRWASLIYAAAAAQYARNVKPFNAEKAALFAKSAQRAWEFGIDPANCLGKITINAKRQRGRGEPYTLAWEETEAHILPFRVHAATQMQRLTGDPKYLANIGEIAAKAKAPFGWRFSHRDFSAWLYAELALNQDGKIPADVAATWRAFYVKTADEFLAQLALMPYRHTWPRHQDYWAGWGAMTVTNYNRALAIAWRLTGEEKYRDAIINNTDFMLGANPLGISWTTGIGYVYPIDFQHANSENDGIMDPVPGITVYGLNGGPSMHYRGRELVWTSLGADGKPVSFIKEANTQVPFYRRFSEHPSINTAQCEFTVHETMASTLFSTAVLLNEGWRPDDALKNRKPRRDDLLFGYWIMP